MVLTISLSDDTDAVGRHLVLPKNCYELDLHFYDLKITPKNIGELGWVVNKLKGLEVGLTSRQFDRGWIQVSFGETVARQAIMYNSQITVGLFSELLKGYFDPATGVAVKTPCNQVVEIIKAFLVGQNDPATGEPLAESSLFEETQETIHITMVREFGEKKSYKTPSSVLKVLAPKHKCQD